MVSTWFFDNVGGAILNEVLAEAMAYDAEAEFAGSTAVFEVEKMIAEKLGL
jgi:hypothetical protein